MMDRTPAPGELYRHFKGGIYQVLTIATHAQTGEQLVVYQAMYGTFDVYAQPLALFMGAVEDGQSAQPQCGYFEKLDKKALAGTNGAGAAAAEPDDTQGRQAGWIPPQPLRVEPAKSGRRKPAEADMENGYLNKRRRQMEEREHRREQFKKPQNSGSATSELQANPNLLKFLDADTYEEKYRVLTEIQDEMTDRLIDDIAVVLDVVIPEGQLSERYYQLRNIILTRQKYETNRFR